MISLEEMDEMLDEIANGFPQELFRDLNGGIILIPEAKLNPASDRNDLYIMGEYHRGGPLGRYISIYYGSFQHIYWHLGKDAIREKLTQVLKHEFTHHLETMAGERGLEIKDAQFLEDYFKHRRK